MSAPRPTQATTPPAEESEADTITVKPSTTRPKRVSLPTPSESATDTSSQASATPIPASPPPKSRSKRVTSTRAATAVTTCSTSEKQRNISGETLVQSANASQTSPLKSGVHALDMEWNMSIDFSETNKAKLSQADEEIESDSSSTITVAIPAEIEKVSISEVEDTSSEDEEERKALAAARLAKKASNEQKWEQRRKAAGKNSTRKSSRASMLMTKATEAISSVLGKRERPATAPEPSSKKARLDTPNADDKSLTSTNRAMRSRAAKDKKWLISGLYAGQLRSFDPALSETQNKAKQKRKSGVDEDTSAKATAVEEKENHTLPLPMFAGNRLLTSGRDFHLPFDVFSPLLSHQTHKPDEWKRVNKNVFVGDAADHWRFSNYTEHSTCMCRPATGCDADCMNRFMYYECDARNCNLSEEQCGNRAFEGLRKRVKKGGKYNVGVEVLKTKDRGNGVRANRCFEEGQIIVEYTGEIVTQEECEARMRGLYKDNEVSFCMPLLFSSQELELTEMCFSVTILWLLIRIWSLMLLEARLLGSSITLVIQIVEWRNGLSVESLVWRYSPVIVEL